VNDEFEQEDWGERESQGLEKKRIIMNNLGFEGQGKDA